MASLFNGEVPNALSILEQNELIIKYYQGDYESRQKLIIHNIRLVTKVIFEKFTNTGIDLNDLFSVGLLGLINGVDSYDLSKCSNYSYYLCRCIENQIYMEIRSDLKSKKISIVSTYHGNDEEEVNPVDLIPSLVNIESDYIEKETYNRLWNIINSLPRMERDIIIDRYFNLIPRNTIGKKYNTSGSNIELMEKKILKTIKEELIGNNKESIDSIILRINESFPIEYIKYKDMFNYYFNLGIDKFYTINDLVIIFNKSPKTIKKIIDKIVNRFNDKEFLINRRKDFLRIYNKNSKLINLHNELLKCDSKRVLEIYNSLSKSEKEVLELIFNRDLYKLDTLREYTYIELKDGEKALSKMLSRF